MYSKVLLVFVGGGIGTVFRFLLNTLINVSSLPQFSTLFINVLGSFLFGIIYSIVAENNLVSIFLLTGILGGFTTYSQFTFDLIQLNTQSHLSTVSYFFATVLLSIFGALIGVYIGSKLVN